MYFFCRISVSFELLNPKKRIDMATQKPREAAKPAARKNGTRGNKKIFVLDTSVILYNHDAVNSFDDNDIAIPITVLEELDNFKKGNETKNFEAREFIRILDRLSEKKPVQDWVPLENKRGGRFRIVIDERSHTDVQQVFGGFKNDHRILSAALMLKEQNPDRKVIIVSKDINLRIKAKALNLPAEDFETGKIKDLDLLYKGKSEVNDLDPALIELMYQQGWCDPKALGINQPIANHYFILNSPVSSVLAFYNPLTMRVERIDKHPVQRINPRNAEQVFALHAITNPEVKLVTLQGVAGTGKTLLALAGALDQRRNFKQIFLARPIVPLSNKDLGFLPGDANEKITPYMEPLHDNLKFIKNQYSERDKEYGQFDEMLQSEKIVISPLAFIRGRSLSNICFIVDEAQNLTPHEVKTIITRAGEGTKIIFTGDIFQIDTPYLDAQSNGLSYLIDKIKHHAIYAHVRLEKGERSELANLANDLL